MMLSLVVAIVNRDVLSVLYVRQGQSLIMVALDVIVVEEVR